MGEREGLGILAFVIWSFGVWGLRLQDFGVRAKGFRVFGLRSFRISGVGPRLQNSPFGASGLGA